MEHAINVQFFDSNSIFLGERKWLPHCTLMYIYPELTEAASLAIFMRNGQEIRRVRLV